MDVENPPEPHAFDLEESPKIHPKHLLFGVSYGSTPIINIYDQHTPAALSTPNRSQRKHQSSSFHTFRAKVRLSPSPHMHVRREWLHYLRHVIHTQT
jgi:hypothetical protein